jgi:23S rRNA pseudouridine1911/1915/1917 synthase
VPEKQVLQVTDSMRLDLFLVQTWPELRRQDVRRMIQGGSISINGTAAHKPGQYLQPGDAVEALAPEMSEPIAGPETELPSPFIAEIVYEDDAIVVMDKPAGMALYPGRRQESGATLLHQLQAYDPEIIHIGGVDHAGMVQRLETEASGLVLVARTEAAYRVLKHDVKHNRIVPHYLALVEGNLSGEDVIDLPIGNVKRGRGRLMVAREGRPAQTSYKALRHYKEGGQAYTLLEVSTESSRLHQIRVHLSWYGYPVVGDALYGSPHRSKLLPDRFFLHLTTLAFPHPITGEPVSVESPMPLDLTAVLRFLTHPKGR